MSTGNKSLDVIIGKMGDLPALPTVVAEVLSITENPNSAMSEVTRVIQSDPALTAKILRLSNSSYYGMRQQVGTLKLALVILGVREVRNIVLGISVFETLKDRSSDVVVAQQIWADSLATAGMAKCLARKLGLGFQGEEFVTGLLADIGKMVLLRQLKDQYASMFNTFRADPGMLLANELKFAGYTHADAAAALSLRWSLPKTLCDSLWCQYPHEERPLMSAKDPKLAATVRIAKAAILDSLESSEGQRALGDEEAWEVLQAAKAPLAPDARLEALREIRDEITESGTVLL